MSGSASSNDAVISMSDDDDNQPGGGGGGDSKSTAQSIDWHRHLEWPWMNDSFVQFHPIAHLLQQSSNKAGGSNAMTDEGDEERKADSTSTTSTLPRLLFTFTYLMPPPPEGTALDSAWVSTHWNVKTKSVKTPTVASMLDTEAPFATMVNLTATDRQLLATYDAATMIPLLIVLVIGLGARAVIRSRLFLLKNSVPSTNRAAWLKTMQQEILVCQHCGNRTRAQLQLCASCRTVFHCSSKCRDADLAGRHKNECAAGPNAMHAQLHYEFLLLQQLATAPTNLFRWHKASQAGTAIAAKPEKRKRKK